MEILKFMGKIKSVFCAFILFAFVIAANAQSQTADRIVAVLGDHIILESDIEGQYAQYLAQGNLPDEGIKCEIFISLLTQKLLLHQAIIDSLELSDDRVEDELDRRMAYFIGQVGSQDKLEEYLGKSVVEFKDELRQNIREMMLAQMMQSEITKDVNVTPAEIKAFYNNIPDDSLPYYNTEVEVGQIIKYPVASKAAKQAAKEKLEALRDRVKKGEDFGTLAILYSQDPGSAKRGGELGFVNRGALVKAFESVAFKLKPMELSGIVETEFGFHILQLIERRGEQVNVRHILIKPEVAQTDMEYSKKVLDTVKAKLVSGEIDFAEAAGKYSDDKKTRNSGGMLQNAQDGTTRIPTDQLEPSVFFVIDSMKVGSFSQPVFFQEESGEKGYRILYYKSKTLPHRANLKEDYQKIQAAALAEKENRVISDWFEDKRSETYIKLDNAYLSCERIAAWYQTKN